MSWFFGLLESAFQAILGARTLRADGGDGANGFHRSERSHEGERRAVRLVGVHSTPTGAM
jgi:hypothetical protein